MTEKTLENLISHVHGLFDEESPDLWEQAQLVRAVKVSEHWEATSGTAASFAQGQLFKVADLLEAKSQARRYRLDGRIAIAMRFEEKAEKLYNSLAPHWRW